LDSFAQVSKLSSNFLSYERVTAMSLETKEWLSLTEASDVLGVHPTTLRRWADTGNIPCFRTPGGHRRFSGADLAAWMEGKKEIPLVLPSDALVHNAVGYTRQEMAQQRVSSETWYLAFSQEQDRQQMRDTGRLLFGLAVQYMGRTHNHEPILQEGKRIGEFYGRRCSECGMGLVDTMRALFFFRESLIRAARPGQLGGGQYDEEDVRIHRQLRLFLDEVMYACLSGYEVSCMHLLREAQSS
jgi:excisionase family DNA binding protein